MGLKDGKVFYLERKVRDRRKSRGVDSRVVGQRPRRPYVMEDGVRNDSDRDTDQGRKCLSTTTRTSLRLWPRA